MIESTDLELEDERMKQLEALLRDRHTTSAHLLDSYQPGSLGYHEATHTTSIILGLVDDQLLLHPAIVANPELFRLASRASEALFNLYQLMGSAQVGQHHTDDGLRPEELNASNDD
ncbi:hypothetical protein [Sinorhizobium sp. BG8]|uniref:hypothetical protein n=1 Tax=Sinorhizobium sp. BG8 TaxID=2613773 RepID=UPI00193E6DC5|nr:hypothetical protein [Sinorhizobium sp. BG8]QRM55488.1 hypothetical protein F3Y30_13840 [Sinorhizobium sp. BG8]